LVGAGTRCGLVVLFDGLKRWPDEGEEAPIDLFEAPTDFAAEVHDQQRELLEVVLVKISKVPIGDPQGLAWLEGSNRRRALCDAQQRDLSKAVARFEDAEEVAMLAELFLNRDPPGVEDVHSLPGVTLLKEILSLGDGRLNRAVEQETEGVQGQAAKGGDAPQNGGISIHGIRVYHPEPRIVMMHT
jgi:hypothetical protein